MEVLRDRFDDLMTEVIRVYLVTNLGYALSLHFVDRLEKNGKINADEKFRHKDVIENEDGELRTEDVTENLKKDIRGSIFKEKEV